MVDEKCQSPGTGRHRPYSLPDVRGWRCPGADERCEGSVEHRAAAGKCCVKCGGQGARRKTSPLFVEGHCAIVDPVARMLDSLARTLDSLCRILKSLGGILESLCRILKS